LNAITSSVVSQLVRSATSVGANYCEADDAESKKDFRHKISICLKEIKETRHWLRMMAAAAPEFRNDARTLYKEAKELNLIFAAINALLVIGSSDLGIGTDYSLASNPRQPHPPAGCRNRRQAPPRSDHPLRLPRPADHSGVFSLTSSDVGGASLARWQKPAHKFSKTSAICNWAWSRCSPRSSPPGRSRRRRTARPTTFSWPPR
jgi:four helix bundle protein